MKNLIVFLLLTASMTVSAQERNDATMVVSMEETTAKDLKCDVYPQPITVEDIQQLMDRGRYVISVTTTKFGTVVVHKQNTENVKQMFATSAYYYDVEKECKKMYRQGYILKYYNEERKYAIYEKNPQMDVQVYQKLASGGKKDMKNLEKLNAKGLYVTLTSFIHGVAHDGLDNIADQILKTFVGEEQLLDSVNDRIANGWIVGSVAKSYNKYGNKSWYKVVFNKPVKKGRKRPQKIGVVNTQEELKAFLYKNKANGYSIGQTWCGWENRDYVAEEERANAYNSNVFEILSGLTNSVSSIVDKGNKSALGSSVEDIYGTTGSSSVGNKTKADTNRCRRCQGTGKCSPVSASGRKNACFGSKLCGYCSGTGWIKAGASEAKCTACNGTGKCKTCGGTGKCYLCHGRGH